MSRAAFCLAGLGLGALIGNQTPDVRYMLPAHSGAQSVNSSEFMEFNVNFDSGRKISLEIGKAYGCNSMSDPRCKMTNLAELWIDGKMIGAIDADTLSYDESVLLRGNMLDVVGKLNQEPASCQNLLEGKIHRASLAD